MNILHPVCTCQHPGILGCAKHTYGPPVYPEPTDVVARKIAGGEAFTDTDARQVADAYLFAIDDGGTP